MFFQQMTVERIPKGEVMFCVQEIQQEGIQILPSAMTDNTFSSLQFKNHVILLCKNRKYNL